MNFKQLLAVDHKNKHKWLKICPTLNNDSGIYMLTREDEDFKYAYIGQSKHILQRLAEHLRGYQHIDSSLRKWGLYSANNPQGWNVDFVNCAERDLEIKEQEYIKEYGHLGYQMNHNKTGGGQIDKKEFEKYQTNGYRKGVIYGEQKQLKLIKVYFDKYLDFKIKGKENKIKIRKYKEFEELINGD